MCPSIRPRPTQSALPWGHSRERRTIADLTLVRHIRGNHHDEILPEFPRQMERIAGFVNDRYGRMQGSSDSAIDSTVANTRAP